jgi:hydrogenase-4 component B
MTAAIIILIMSLSSCAITAICALLVTRSYISHVLAVGGSIISLCALAAGWIMLANPTLQHNFFYFALPLAGHLSIRLNRLSGMFLIVFGLVCLPISIFSLRYLEKMLKNYSLRFYGIWYSSLLFSIILILIAGDIITFFIAWELMSVTSALLVSYEHKNDKGPAAAWLMFITSETGALAFLGSFILLAANAHTLQFSGILTHSASFSPGLRTVIFALSFFGFATKTGLVPVNFWLPRAHPEAPGPISALLSAFILNCGIYGIFLVNVVLLPVRSVWIGVVVMIIGTITAILGILYAAISDDIKTVLAHSSSENMGLMTIATGASMIFLASHDPVLAGIGFMVAIFQMTNHSIYKALLFLGAAAVHRQTNTRSLDKLGGLIKVMPWTSGTFLIGALSISSLPPFSGFTSEWLLIQTLLQATTLHSTTLELTCAIAAVFVGLTAALSVTCFVRVFSMGFLGHPRTQVAKTAKEIPHSMRFPLGLLATLCIGIGILPTICIPIFSRALSPGINSVAVSNSLIPPFFSQIGHSFLNPNFQRSFLNIGAGIGQHILPGSSMVILHQGGTANPVTFATSPFDAIFVLIFLLVLTRLLVKIITRKRTKITVPAWTGGMRTLLPEMTYTSTAFAKPVNVIFQSVIHNRTVIEERDAVHEHFRSVIHRHVNESHIIDRYFLEPIGKIVLNIANTIAKLHTGRIKHYSALVMITFVTTLIIAIFF